MLVGNYNIILIAVFHIAIDPSSMDIGLAAQALVDPLAVQRYRHGVELVANPPLHTIMCRSNQKWIVLEMMHHVVRITLKTSCDTEHACGTCLIYRQFLENLVDFTPSGRDRTSITRQQRRK